MYIHKIKYICIWMDGNYIYLYEKCIHAEIIVFCIYIKNKILYNMILEVLHTTSTCHEVDILKNIVYYVYNIKHII